MKYKKISLIVLAIQLCAATVQAVECCGDTEYDPSAVGASQTWDVSAVASAIEAAVSAIPYIDDPEADASATISFSPCCDGSDTVVDDGVGTVSGDASVSVTFEKTLSPISLDVSVNVIGCGEIGGIVGLGPYVTLTPSLSINLTGSVDNCDNTTDWGGSGTASGSVTGGVRAETVIVVCDKSASATANASATTGVQGTFSWNSETGATGNACVNDLTGDISASVDLPFWGPYNFDLIEDYSFLEGNC